MTRIDSAAGLFLRGVRPLHRTLPGHQYRQESEPEEIALGVRAYLNEFGRPAKAALGQHISQEAVFQCTTCGACEFQCPVGIQHLPMIIGLRRGAVNTGQMGGRLRHQAVPELWSATAMRWASRQSERDKFIAEAGAADFDGTQEYCLWLGCMGAYDPQGREIIASFAR